MKAFTIYDLRFTILAAMLAAATTAEASLTAVVTPGYQFPLDGSVAPSYALLDLLATPTVSIYGNLGGSNNVDPGSITGTQLASSVLTTGGGLAWDGGTPQGIELAAQGVLTNNLNTNDWRWPLAQPTLASPLQLNYDPLLFNTNTAGLTFNYDTNVFGTNGAGLTLARGFINTVAGNSTNGAAVSLALDPGVFAIVTQSNALTGTNMQTTLTLSAAAATLAGPAVLAAVQYEFTNAGCFNCDPGLTNTGPFLKTCTTHAFNYLSNSFTYQHVNFGGGNDADFWVVTNYFLLPAAATTYYVAQPMALMTSNNNFAVAFQTNNYFVFTVSNYNRGDTLNLTNYLLIYK